MPHKGRWNITADSGDPGLAIDDHYATMWLSDPSTKPWLEIDLGEVATLGGLEVYWGKETPIRHGFEASLDRETWTQLCSTRHGEGGQEVFAFPPIAARFVRWKCDNPEPARTPEIVEINLYGPADAASVVEGGRIAALGHAPVKLPPGESITVDFGYVRFPLGAFIKWGETYGTVFSVHLSDDGAKLPRSWPHRHRQWRQRQLLVALHHQPLFSLDGRMRRARPKGAVVNELKLRLLNKDRMPFGQFERAARAGRGDLYPQSLLGRQVYWTVVGESDQPEEALFDEYGNLEPQAECAQITPLLRLGGVLHGAPASAAVSQSLVDGSLADSERHLVHVGR